MSFKQCLQRRSLPPPPVPTDETTFTSPSPSTTVLSAKARPRRRVTRCRLLSAVGVTGLLLPLSLLLPVSKAFADTTTSLGNIQLGAYWSGNAGYGSSAPSAYLTSNGDDEPVVHLQGAAKQIAPPFCAPSPHISCPTWDPNVVGWLPRAAWPDRTVFTIVHTMNGTYADLYISPQGQITLYGTRQPAVQDYSFVSLEGVTYGLTSAPAFSYPGRFVISSDWSSNPGYGASAPDVFQTDPTYNGDSGLDHLVGAVAQVSTNINTMPGWPRLSPNLIGELPYTEWPQHDVHTIVHTLAGTYADLTIDTGGDLFLTGPPSPAVTDFRFVSLEGVTYWSSSQSASPDPSQPLALNTVNWSGSGFDPLPVGDVNLGGIPDTDAVPGWDQDPSGIVHLEGEATQVSNYGTGNPNLVGTLPSSVRPSRYVYTIAATANGTYADLVITTKGQIFLIGPRPPAAQNYSDVSLDGISYQP